jgi:hypothetical protein
MDTAPLPRVDEHATVVAASVGEVWPALLETLDRTFSRPVVSVYARIVGCAEATASGPRPLAEGAKIPGFRVAAADPARELVLEGRHRFSSYALTFHLDQLGSGSSRLRAESQASFPGMAGRLYRLLVIGTGRTSSQCGACSPTYAADPSRRARRTTGTCLAALRALVPPVSPCSPW